MTTAIIGVGLLRVCNIVYRCDVARPGSDEIPLGIMVDVRIGNRYGIGLRTRTEISQKEADKVGRLVRDAIRRPAAFLKGEFERVKQSSEPAREFGLLPELHAMALHFSNPEVSSISLPRSLIGDAAAPEVREWIMDELRKTLAGRWWSFVHDADGSTTCEDALAA